MARFERNLFTLMLPMEFRMTESDERNWILFLHLSGFLGGLAICCGSLVIPMMLWLIKREESVRVDWHGKEVLNFQISLLIYWFGLIVFGCMVAWSLGFILVVLPFLWMAGIGTLFLQWIFGIIGAVKASDGIDYRYPLNLRLIP